MNIALTHWSATWPVLVGYAAVAGAQLYGLRILLAENAMASGAMAARDAPGGGAGRLELQREAAIFQVGLLAVLLALVSPVAYWSNVYIWVRGIQDLLLVFVAPALIVLGAPWSALRRCWPGGDASGGRFGDGDRVGAGGERLPRVPGLLAWPVAITVAFNVIWLGWHLPVLFDLARTSSAVGFVEHAMCLGAGIAFWLQLIGSRPCSPSAAPLRRVALVVGTVIAGTILGMVLVFGSSVLYPAYGGAAHHVMTVLDDQQLAGAVLWMGMLPPLIIAAVALLLRWLGDEESAELSAGLDRLLTQRKSSWPSRPGLR
jgi:putative membrane protein